MDYSFLDFLCLIGSVGMFLYGMKVMSEGLQKAAGDRLRSLLSAMTRNRFTGLLTGIFITALIQSSSASTVMVVSFVNAGLMSLGQSMAVIMGANVGTTFTTWIITLFGFKVNIGMLVLPLIGLAIPLLFSSKSRLKSMGEFLIGFGFLFMGLDFIQDYVPDLQANPEMFAVLEQWSHQGFLSVLLFLCIGIILTMVIQASSATFAIVLIMCAKGWIDFPLACAMVLGSNIGTTITPLLASMSGNIAARRTAMGHLLFNFFGTVWTLAIFYPFIHLTSWCTIEVGQGDPTALFGYVTSLDSTDPSALQAQMAAPELSAESANAQMAAMETSVSFGLAIFHTLFNLFNLAIMIWLTKVYVKVVEWLVPQRKKKDEGDDFQLKFISGGLLSASELNISQAEKEVSVYAQRVDRMIDMAQRLVHTKADTTEFAELLSRIEKYEDISDRMEIEIANYLNKCSEGRLSNESKVRVAALLRIVSEIESIADCCSGTGKILLRKQQSNAHFNEEIYSHIDQMFVYVAQAMKNMLALLDDMERAAESEIVKSYNLEREINNYRNQLRSANIENINNHRYDYQEGIYYMDIIGNLEKTGDYIINVVDAIKDHMRQKRLN